MSGYDGAEIGWLILYWGVLGGIVFGGISLIQRHDSGDWRIGKREREVLFCLCTGEGILIDLLPGMKGIDGILFAMIGGCLLFACVTDYRTFEVFQFTWWPAGAAGGLLLWRHIIRKPEIGNTDVERVWTFVQMMFPLLFYVLLQELFFCHMYGRADCHAFVISAIAGYVLEIGMLGYLLHMAMAFGILGIVQALRHNINRRGNLKHPVAFLPYITFSFWVLIWGYAKLPIK